MGFSIESTLRGVLGRKSAQELTQAEIRCILQQTSGELKEIWLEIDVLGKDAPSSEGKEVEGLRNQYRTLACYYTTMVQLNNSATPKSDLSVLGENQTEAKALHRSVVQLRKDVLTTSKRIYGLSSRFEVNVIQNPGATSEDARYELNTSPDSAGVSVLFQTVRKLYNQSKKTGKKGSKPDSSSEGASTHSSNTSDMSRWSTSSQHSSDPSLAERPVASREDTSYRVRLRYRTSAEEIVLTGENQAELENPAWMDTALDAIPQGRMIESQVQPTLDRLTRQTSVDNISLSTTYFDAESGTVLDI